MQIYKKNMRFVVVWLKEIINVLLIGGLWDVYFVDKKAIDK